MPDKWEPVMAQIVSMVGEAAMHEAEDFAWTEGSPTDFEYDLLTSEPDEDKLFLVFRRTMEILGGRHDGAVYKSGYVLDLTRFQWLFKQQFGDVSLDFEFAETEDSICEHYLSMFFRYEGIAYHILLISEEHNPELATEEPK